MAPRINKSKSLSPPITGGSAPSTGVNVSPQNEELKLKELRAEIEQNCDYVGNQFAEEARKFHYGDTEAKNIYGEASLEDAKELLDEGVEFTLSLGFRKRIPDIRKS